MAKDHPVVAVVMGSTSDWSTMAHTKETLVEFGVECDCRVVSAHRTPEWMRQFAHEAEAHGIKVIVAAAGGAAHLPGMLAAQTQLPVLGVPIRSHALAGVDSLLSIVQMPAGIPVGTLAIGKPGAINAALLAVAILATTDAALARRLATYRQRQTDTVMASTLPPADTPRG